MGGYIEPQQEFGDFLLRNDGQDDKFINSLNADTKYIYGTNADAAGAAGWSARGTS
jgi:hypothetical protein